MAALLDMLFDRSNHSRWQLFAIVSDSITISQYLLVLQIMVGGFLMFRLQIYPESRNSIRYPPRLDNDATSCYTRCRTLLYLTLQLHALSDEINDT